MKLTTTLLATYKRQITAIAAIISFLSLSITGCDSTFVDPFTNDTRFFTIYGYLDEANNLPGAGINAVRVIPITRRAEVITSPDDPQAFIDARVFVVNVFTGQEIEWRHTLERFSDTQYGHVFKSNMRISQNTAYRIEVRRSDGIVTTAETTVPAVSSINIVQDPQPIIDSATNEIRQGILLPGVNNVWSIDLTYYLAGGGCFTTSPVPVSYGRAGERTEEGWRFEANVSRDLSSVTIGDPTSENPIANPTLCAIGLEVRVADNDWMLPDPLAQDEAVLLSEVPSNVENGLGFFGSVGVINNAWNTTNALRSAFAQQ